MYIPELSHGDLLDQKYAKLRDSTPVAILEIKKRPNLESSYDYETFSRTEIYPEFMDQVVSPNCFYLDDFFFHIDKREPHSLFDFTSIERSKKPRLAFELLNKEARIRALQLAKSFGEYCENLDLYPMMSITYDPTTDRHPTQTLKRAHFHYVARTQEELRTIRESSVKLADFSKQVFAKRQIVDEGTIVFSQLAYDLLKNTKTKLLSLRKPYEDQYAANPGLVFVLSHKRWENLNLPAVDEELTRIFLTLRYCYNNIVERYLPRQFGHWIRPKVSITRIYKIFKDFKISDHALEMLLYFLKNFNTYCLDYFGGVATKCSALNTELINLYPLCGFNYGMHLSKDLKNNRLTLILSPKVFASSGGTGINYISGVQVRIDRGKAGIFNSKELESRAAFIKNFSIAIDGSR